MTFKNALNIKSKLSHTYILDIGNKGSNQLPVLNKIESELNEIRSGSLLFIFHGLLQKYAKPIVLPILRHGNQPERRSIKLLKLGNNLTMSDGNIR